mgnify:CR=1 FL=1
MFIAAAAAALTVSCVGAGTESNRAPAAKTVESGVIIMNTGEFETAVLGGGCFWCLEGAYEIVPGVVDVENGYAGGGRANPTYEQVGTGLTGHAEVVKITFDPAKVTYTELLDLFWKIHDPTTLNRQGADIGPQYRSIILYSSPEQEAAAKASIAKAAPSFRNPIVTELKPLETYWKAEGYHQDYFRRNPDQGYCQVVVAPKVDKAREWIRDNP